MIVAQIMEFVKILYNICTNRVTSTLAKFSPILMPIFRARSPVQCANDSKYAILWIATHHFRFVLTTSARAAALDSASIAGRRV